MADVAGLGQLLSELTSQTNEVRSGAETRLEAIPAPQRAQLLFQFYCQSGDEENRNFALVLLRRLLSNSWEEVWPALGPEAQTGIKEQLLLRLRREESEQMRKRLADVVAEVARNLLDENVLWTEVLEFLHQSVSDSPNHLKMAALSILESVPCIFGVEQAKYLQVIRDMLGASLISDSAEVRSAAVRATTSFLCDNDEDQKTLSACQPLVPAILKVCQDVVLTGADDDTPLQCLGDLATSLPKSLKPHLNDVAQLCLEVCAKAELEDSLRHSALEVMVSLCESSAAMMRKRGSAFIGPLIKVCLDLMVELEDDEDWHTTDDLDSDDDNNAAVGETSLDRIATSLGGKAVFPPTAQLVPAMMQSAEWTHRHAGLMALSTIGEGCKKAMEPRIAEIVASIIPYVKDPHPRVRYAACNALGQMSTDFAPVMEKRCHGEVLPALLTALEDMTNPRVAAHAASAIVNFAEDCPKDVLVGYLDPLMEKLEWALQQTFKMLEAGKKLVLEQVITTIASVADTAQDHYVRYYDRVMPSLKYILANAAGAPQLRLLRGKCIECISLIGLAVGKEKFVPDAGEVMELLLKSQAEFGTGEEADDPSTSYIISASARICKLLGADFAAYLPVVMPAVMKAAELKPEVTVVDAEDGEEMAGDDEWTFVGVGDQSMLGIKTAGLEDKANACQMLVCYARELKAAFADYVEPVTKLMVPLLKFYFHDGVRSAASESLAHLLAAAAGKGPDFVQNMWGYIFPDLLKAVEEEPETEVTADHLWGLSKCVETLGAGCLDQGRMAALFEVLKKLLEKHFEKATERAKRRADEDHDEEEESELIDEDEEDSYVISKVSDVVHAAFATHGPQVATFFQALLPHLQEMLKPGRAYGDRQWALCLFDDLIEFAPHESPKYRDLFVPHMMAGLGDAHPEVRQAAAYGFGVLGLQADPDYGPTIASALPALATVIEAEGSRDSSEAAEATENAISAVCKILKCHPGVPDPAPYIGRIPHWLPTWEDKEEAVHIYGYFADQMEANSPHLLGPENANLPQLLLIIGTAFEKEAFDAEAAPVAQRLARLVRMLQANAEVFAKCADLLPDSTKQALAQALNAYPEL